MSFLKQHLLKINLLMLVKSRHFMVHCVDNLVSICIKIMFCVRLYILNIGLYLADLKWQALINTSTLRVIII